MRKNIALIVFAFVAILASCSPARDTQITLQEVPVSKTWKILSMSYGTEDPASATYEDFRITFTKDSYTITDRVGSKFIFLGKDFPVAGKWNATATPSQGLVFETSVTKRIFVKETSRILSPSILNLEFIAEVPVGITIRKFG